MLSIEEKTIQQEIFSKMKENLTPFLHETLTEENWIGIITLTQELFEELKYTNKILRYEKICQNIGEDFILEYDINFSQGWFLYMHLRNQHLMVKFIPKEF